MPITIKNSAGGGVTLDSTTSNNETVNLPTGGGTLVGTATPSFTGNATITSGNLVIATAGKGLAVGGTGANNTLSDYEEGNFTPAASGVSLASVTSKYTKIGRNCTIGLQFAFPSNSNSTLMRITGMPFSTNLDGNVTYGYTDSGITNLGIFWQGATLYFFNRSGTALTQSNFSGKTIRMSCTAILA